MFKRDWIRFGDDESETGLCVWPARASAPLPGIVVIQEAWGVDRHIEDLALRFAQAGYVTLAPDLFADGGERPAPFAPERMEALKAFINTIPPGSWTDPKAREEALEKLSEPERTTIGESFTALFSALPRIGEYVPKLLAATEYLRSEHPLARGTKIGCIGYCMGGALAGRLACADPALGAAVMYYGSAPPAEEIPQIHCPVLAFYGGLDTRINKTLPDFEAAMQTRGKRFEHHMYDGAGHAFFNDERPSYHAQASRDALARTLEFFRQTL